MKNLIIATSLALGLVSAAIAQPVMDERGARAEQHAQKRLDRMSEELNLTPAQRVEVEAIFTEQAVARREMQQRHRSEREALAEQGKTRLSTVLSPEQQTRLEELRAERKERWEGRRDQRGHKRHGRRDGTR